MSEEKKKEKKTMMQRRDELIKESVLLNQLAFDDTLTTRESYKVKERQNEVYKKYKWIDNYIKAERKVKNND